MWPFLSSRYLIPCNHMMLSQRWAVKERDCYSVSAAKLLALTPVCCSSGITLTLGNQERDYILWSKCTRDSPGRGVADLHPGPLKQYKLTRGQGRNSGRAFLGLLLQPKNKKQMPLLAPQAGGQAGPLSGVRVGVNRWVGSEGWLRWSADPLAVLVLGPCSVPCCFWHCRRGGPALAFLYAVFILCPICACMRLFSVPHSFVFCCWRGGGDACPGVSTDAQGPGPRPPRQPSLVITFINTRIPDAISLGCVSLLADRECCTEFCLSYD